MVELEAIYAVWWREFKVYFRERERIISSIVSPIMWLVLFGTGLGASVAIDGFGYQQFIFPGLVAMAVLFTSIFYGVYIIWDRKLDVLKAVLVAPVARSSIFFGKLLGGCTDAMFQGVILMLVGILLGIAHFTPASFLLSFLILLPMSMAVVSIGLIIGSNLKTPEAFQLVITFVMWPMFMLSGALFPIGNLPSWLAVLTYLNPLTYGVDALRGSILGVQVFPLWLDVAAMLAFSALAIAVGIVSFGRMQQAK
jgi:ABC-2 type transport system permease protein